MSTNTRHLIACLATSLVSGQEHPVLKNIKRDYTTAESTQEQMCSMEVEANGDTIDLHCSKHQAYYTGEREGTEWLIYDFNTDDLIRFNLERGQIVAYDFATETAYEGKVDALGVSLWDRSHESHYAYALSA